MCISISYMLLYSYIRQRIEIKIHHVAPGIILDIPQPSHILNKKLSTNTIRQWKAMKWLMPMRLINPWSRKTLRTLEINAALSFFCKWKVATGTGCHWKPAQQPDRMVVHCKSAKKSRTLFQYPKRRLIVRSHKVSKPRDLYLTSSDRFEIWQAPRQHWCQCDRNISTLNLTPSRLCEKSR